MQIQGSNTKDSKPKESRFKNLKPAKRKTFVSPRPKSTELKKTFCLNKRKEYLMKKKRDRKNSTSAIGDNAVEASEKKWIEQGDGKYFNY